jgi:hypothetical protein
MALCVLGLSACSKPKPDTERRPEPTAANAQARDKRLANSIQAPMDRAKSTEQTVLDQGRQQAADIDAQTAGNASPPAAH